MADPNKDCQTFCDGIEIVCKEQDDGPQAVRGRIHQSAEKVHGEQVECPVQREFTIVSIDSRRLD